LEVREVDLATARGGELLTSPGPDHELADDESHDEQDDRGLDVVAAVDRE
jgi:hypothetical protein